MVSQQVDSDPRLSFNAVERVKLAAYGLRLHELLAPELPRIKLASKPPAKLYRRAN